MNRFQTWLRVVSWARRLILWVIVAMTLQSAALGQSDRPVFIKGQQVHPTQILAKLTQNGDLTRRAAALKVQKVGVRRQYRLIPRLVMIDSDSTEIAALGRLSSDDQARRLLARINALRDSGQFEYVEPDYIVHAALTPTDTAFVNGATWGLQNTGQNGGVAGMDVNVVPAWDVTTGSTSVVVGIIDSGIRYTHQDLQAQMWVNPGEIAGNGIDDDGDGYIDDVYGINVLTGSGDPNDDYGHGTVLAGIVGAAANDGNPMVGVAWNVRLMALKFENSTGAGSISGEITCIEYAVAKGARVLNASYGQNIFSQAEYDAIAAAGQQGVLFVAAAGNDAASCDNTPFYPANYVLNNVISVAAIDPTGALASFSNYGNNTVHLGAPGVSIYSTHNLSDSDYVSGWYGTSFSAPYVVGTAALILSKYPTILVEDLRNRILNTTTATPALQGTTITGGRLNAYQALAAIPTGTLQVSARLENGNSFVPGRAVTMYVHVTDLLAVTNATVTGSAPGVGSLTFSNDGVAPTLRPTTRIIQRRSPRLRE